MNEVTAEQKTAVLQTVFAVRDAIKELGEVPSGELYAHLMGKLSLANYNAIIKVLQDAGLIVVSNHLITWKGGH